MRARVGEAGVIAGKQPIDELREQLSRRSD